MQILSPAAVGRARPLCPCGHHPVSELPVWEAVSCPVCTKAQKKSGWKLWQSTQFYARCGECGGTFWFDPQRSNRRGWAQGEALVRLTDEQVHWLERQFLGV